MASHDRRLRRLVGEEGGSCAHHAEALPGDGLLIRGDAGGRRGSRGDEELERVHWGGRRRPKGERESDDTKPIHPRTRACSDSGRGCRTFGCQSMDEEEENPEKRLKSIHSPLCTLIVVVYG